jgi:hypothetical protein
LDFFRLALQEEATKSNGATQSNANNDSISRYLCHQRTFPWCAAGGGADGGGGGSGGGAAAELHLSSDLLSRPLVIPLGKHKSRSSRTQIPSVFDLFAHRQL